jgi:pimeloyl-ACP methyl ester carboxylesterase
MMRCGLKQGVTSALLAMNLLPGVLQVVAAAEMESRETVFQSAAYRLKGTVTRPVGWAVGGGVLIIPGSGPVDRDGALRMAPSLPPVYRQWAEQLSENGFVVLRYDKRFLTYPDIDIPSFDQEAQITDALSALTSLRSLLGPASQPIFIVGHSEGGTLAPLVAERAGVIASVAVINSVLFPVDELVTAQLRAQPNTPRSMVEDVDRRLAQIKDGSFPNHGLLLGAGRQYWAQWMAYSRRAQETLSRLPIPLLLHPKPQRRDPSGRDTQEERGSPSERGFDEEERSPPPPPRP